MPSATTARSLPLVAIALAAFVLVINVRIIAGGKTWDDARYHTEVAPPRLAAAASVRSLHIPAWWDGTGFGVPLLAEPSHGALVPPMWLASSPRSLDWLQLVHIAWCALGVAVWARRRTNAASYDKAASDPSALVAGLLVATTGLLASAAVRGALPGLAHLPWIGLCASRLAIVEAPRERARMAVALGALLGLVALSGVLAAFVDGVLIAIVFGRRWRWLLGAVVAGAAIGAVQWIPALLHLPHVAGATVQALPLARLLELIVPVHGLAGVQAWAPSLFVGAPLIALAAVRVPSRRVLALILALVALALVVGRGGWPAWLGAPELHVGALAIVLGMMSAPGLDALLDGKQRALRAMAAAIGCSVIALAAMIALRAKHPDAAIDRALLDGGIGVAFVSGALFVAWRYRSRDETTTWPVPVILALLVLPNAGAQGSIAPLVDREIVMREPPFATALDAARAASTAPVRVFRPAFMHDGDADLDTEMATLAGSSAARWGLAGARSESPARIALHDRTWLAAASEGGALLDRFGIGAAILPSTMVDSPKSKFHELARRGEWALVSLPVAPVASVARSWMWQRDPGEALQLMFTPGGGTSMHRGTIVLGGAGPVGQAPREPTPCDVRAWEFGEIDLACTDAGYAVVTSSPAPGWSASVNGEDRAWVTADVLRRAVMVPANASIVWTYRAPGFAASLLFAASGVLILAALLVAGRRRADSADVN